MYKTSKENPPPFDGVEYWERGLEPNHPDAFTNVLTWLERVFHFGFKRTVFSKRKSGWYLINQENVEGYIPDGTEYNLDTPVKDKDFYTTVGSGFQLRAFQRRTGGPVDSNNVYIVGEQ